MKRIQIGLLWLVFLGTACSIPDDQQARKTTQVFEPEMIPETLTPLPEVEDLGYSPEQIASLESLKLMDDFPLYSMDYYGSYETVDVAGNDFLVLGGQQNSDGWACSLFASFNDPENKLYGRNFDWEYSPAVLLFTDPTDGYASVSMVDIAYLGFGGSRGRQLLELPLSELDRLLDAPYLPFDGMNEYGLAVGMAAVPASGQPDRPELETIDSLMVIRLMLDHARNVDEALAIFNQYNLDWGSGPALHYLIADRTGRSILLEYWNGETMKFESQGPWQAATNFLQSGHPEDQSGYCHRYDAISEALGRSEEIFLTEDAMQLLADVSQTNTQWSVVYSLSDGNIRIVMGQVYEQVVTTRLDMANDD